MQLSLVTVSHSLCQRHGFCIKIRNLRRSLPRSQYVEDIFHETTHSQPGT